MSQNPYYYNKIKGNSIHMTTCFLGFDRLNNTIENSALLDLVFSNISDLSISVSSSLVVTPDKYHPPLPHFNFTLDCDCISLTPHHSYAQDDYLLLCNVLHHSDWSYVLNQTSVDSAVNNLTAMVREAINLAIPYIKSKNSTFLH
jgi:hypothetical protein